MSCSSSSPSESADPDPPDAGALVPVDAAAPETEPARPVNIRAGLPNVAAKLEDGQHLTIVYLGGSITRKTPGYADPTTEWFESEFPESEFTAFNEGIGGTNSAFGARRCERDVLSHQPDLVFVEFVVNDRENDASRSSRDNMERIVRKLFEADPSTDVLFLYTVGTESLDTYREGRLSLAARFHEMVAEHYAIPNVSLGFGIVDAIDAGELTENGFAKGGVHPTTAGYAVYNDTIQQALRQMLDEATPRELPEDYVTPGLQVHFPEPEPTAPPAPEPLSRGAETAVSTYQLPVAALHWVGQPYFPTSEDALWALFAESYQGPNRATPQQGHSIAIDRSKWTGAMGWLSEGPEFYSSEGLGLFHERDGSAALSVRESDRPIVEFVAPQAGRYAFEFTVEEQHLWSNHNRGMLHVLRFTGTQRQLTLPAESAEPTLGTSIAVSQAFGNEDEPVQLDGEARLAGGDGLAFALGANASSGGGGVLLEGVRLRVGYFGE